MPSSGLAGLGATSSADQHDADADAEPEAGPDAGPEPEGFSDYSVKPSAASYRKDMGEFLLPYESVRTAADPTAVLFDFCQSTYEAAAINAKWPRADLERTAEQV